MLRRISTNDVKPGMFVHGIDGSWFSHPFWRRRFVVAGQSDINALKEAGVDYVFIDDERGLAPEKKAPVVEIREEAEPATTPEPIPEGPASITTERERAAAIITRSKETMRGVFDQARLGKTVESAEVAAVVDEISGSVRRNAHALIGMVRLKSKDEYTYLHSVAVCALMVNFARQLGLPDAMTRDFGLAGLVHDIGKMGVPDDILNKPGQLTDEEFAVIQAHPRHGGDMLLRAPGIPEAAIDVCHHHHEKVDGTGYPFGLKGEEISLAARMGAICDVYDALTSDRAYKAAWSPGEAVTKMAEWRGQFDPNLLFVFFQSVAIFPVGMLVRLQSNHLGIILSNGRRATRPRVRVFYDMVDDCLIAPRDITMADSEAGELVVASQDPAAMRIHDWERLRHHLSGELDQLNPIEIERLWYGDRDITANEPLDAPTERVSTWRPSNHLN